ncbi:alpha/beta hydrolase fold domain-containing protein [Streptomyces sp. H27-D2]|uniref:alpha/beta hydrolase fold domain-containing protein n=1 Tax=Streptomyces sp. H27-D2 TaxID=3046304 RepID=UPI002DBFE181|nr:alpha/beta hydrolase fold domain-containing protein [Streptomyces sp. H27-D2]MEC4020949.1 alpha/beta hydrolase fold domain-containing protein [Streptomyces sp. H27-D2]
MPRLSEEMADIAYAPGAGLSDTRLGGRPALRVRPASGSASCTVLHLHGGGYRTGDPAASGGLASYLAAGCDAENLLPAYRLAPEHPFPAAADDALAAYTELLERGVAPERLAVLGASAGGGLAAAMLLRARAAGLPRPAAVVLLSPWLDLTNSADSYVRCAASDPLLSREILASAAADYLAGADPRTPTASPLFAGDAALAWMPPLLVQASRDEVLADDASRFADRVNRAGGDCTLQTWAGIAHCWQFGVPLLPEAVEAVDAVTDFLRARLA